MPLNLPEIIRLRLAGKWSFRELAKRAGWGPTGGRRWQLMEQGKPSDPQLSTVEAVAKALGVKVDGLLKKEAKRGKEENE